MSVWASCSCCAFVSIPINGCTGNTKTYAVQISKKRPRPEDFIPNCMSKIKNSSDLNKHKQKERAVNRKQVLFRFENTEELFWKYGSMERPTSLSPMRSPLPDRWTDESQSFRTRQYWARLRGTREDVSNTPANKREEKWLWAVVTLKQKLPENKSVSICRIRCEADSV